MKARSFSHQFALLAATLPLILLVAACTQQKPNSFRLEQQLESFAVAREVNTKVDLLFIVDNSASMDVSQDRLRRGFSTFAQKYLRPNWDIRVGVITTDSYMAHPAFGAYLKTTIGGTENWTSPYIQSRLSTFVNPDWNPSLVNPQTGAFKKGITWNDQVPAWGRNYARLLPGVHDGPIAALCTENHAYFFYGASQCRIRDDQTRYSGPSQCLSPSGGETAITQCVNTVQNDTIHSGRPILSTQSGSQTLVSDFMINASVGTSGAGSERGLASLQQFLQDNETSDTAFFRKGSQRVFMILADEDDQSMFIPAAGANPFTGYSSDCPLKTVDGYSYRLSSCADSSKLIPVSQVKNQVDTFFAALDGTTGGAGLSGTYIVIPVVPLTGSAIQELQQLRASDDLAAGNAGNVAVDHADRYLEFSEQVGNGSFAMNIADDDYSMLLDRVGRAIVHRSSEYELKRPPTGTEDMIVTIIHVDGTKTVLPADTYTVEGTTLYLNDMDFILTLSSQDRILVNYQPKTLY